MPLPWLVGRDSVEPKLDFLGKRHGSPSVALPFSAINDALQGIDCFT
jgi:hypothetical protein